MTVAPHRYNAKPSSRVQVVAGHVPRVKAALVQNGGSSELKSRRPESSVSFHLHEIPCLHKGHQKRRHRLAEGFPARKDYKGRAARREEISYGGNNLIHSQVSAVRCVVRITARALNVATSKPDKDSTMPGKRAFALNRVKDGMNR